MPLLRLVTKDFDNCFARRLSLLPAWLACFNEAIAMIMRPMWQGTEAQPYKELNPANIYMSLKLYPSPFEPSDEYNLTDTLIASYQTPWSRERTQPSHSQIPDLQKP